MLGWVGVNAGDAVRRTDTGLEPSGQKIQYANPAFLRRTGYREDEVLGNTPRMLQGPNTDRAALDEIRNALETGVAVRAELVNYSKEGREYLIETDIVPVASTDGETKRFIAVQRDITDRKQAEKERKILLGQLGERVKELRLLHEASLILQDEKQSLQAMFHRIVERLPSAWRFPNETVARVRYREAGGSYEAASPGFEESPWMQSVAFETNAPGQGMIEIAYLGDHFTGDEEPFLPEETAVLGSLTQMLRAYLDRRHGRERNEVLTADLSSQLSRAAALQKISEVTLSGADLGQTLDVILEQVAGELGVDAANVLLFDADNQTLNYAASVGFRTSTIEKKSLRLGEGMGGKALLQRKPIAISDIAKSAAAFEPANLIEHEVFVSYYAIPLIAKGQIQGLLAVFHRERLEFSREWPDVATDIARQSAIAIDNASLFADLQRSNVDLQLSYDRTIEGWARALDLKDEETAGHSQRVTRLAVAMAKKLGISGEDLANIRRGALLHDIGKMGIPDDILLKPGKLDAHEWEIMQRHTTYARDFLAGIPFLERALDIPYAHHEKWDGSGYPRGLRGDDIPLSARIFAIVDVYDALTSERPYRPAWTPSEARDHVRSESGTHFDPRVVEAFLELLDETGPAEASAEAE
jgi:PAS domain S-box-containing protein/putative nucleotidyltransferase with HDIG domain